MIKLSRCWRFLAAASLLISILVIRADEPEWIWNSTAQNSSKTVVFFRKTFNVKTELLKTTLYADADDSGEFFINGKKVATVSDWNTPAVVDISKQIVRGDNVIAVRCINATSYGGILAKIDMTIPTSGSPVYDPKSHAGLRSIVSVVSSTNWLYSDREKPDWTSPDFDDDNWKPAVSEGKLGVKPWGTVFSTREATPASALHVLPGFKVDLLRSADATEGSWIAMVADARGRMIISPQGTESLLRYTISHGHVRKIERIDQPVGVAMGLLWYGDSLYLNGRGPKGTGIYRLRQKGDQFEAPLLLRLLSGEGEHGSHGLVVGPDKKIYVVSGNFTKIPKNILPSSPLKNYADDQLLPRAPDGKGFGNGLLPPGGFVLRMNLDGTHAELFAAGTRNTYDIAFSPAGELFGFDSDMEWDWGTAWYRPIRVNHWVSGGDYGFREGSGKFPEYYEDTLPANFDVGIGSPTGVEFATKSNFPRKYRESLFMLDWSYGRIFAYHPDPMGATYGGTVETVLHGTPLNLTALDFGKDGALYFITGGRGTESGLYRLSYSGTDPGRPRPTQEQRVAKAEGEAGRKLRHQLEYFHGKRDPRAIDFAWPCLGSDDRWIRDAARTALEFQNYVDWKDRALAETNPVAALTGLMALVRCAPDELQGDELRALAKFPLSSLTAEEQLIKLRDIELCFCRQGRPNPDLAAMVVRELDPVYPSASQEMNRELCQILLYLKAPGAISKTLALLAKAPTQEEQTAYILHLRTITNGWTLDQRKQYLSWFGQNRDAIKHPPELLQYFADAGRDYSDGASLSTFLTNFKNDAKATLTADEREKLPEFFPAASNKTTAAPALVAHTTIKNWRMQDIEPDLNKLKSQRSFDRGQEAYTSAGCILCHRFGKTGGSVGPELAAVSSRLTSRDILESILLPSKVLSEQYQNTIITLKNGDDLIGRVADETDQKLTVITDLVKNTKTEVKKSDIASRRASKVSPMPEGLVNFMTEDQILDLIAYLQSGGKKSFAAFKN